MGADLVSACIFCAGVLFGGQLPPPEGYHAEVGFSYATAARRLRLSDGRDDVSDVTPKFVLLGLGFARPAPAGMGAGTPAAQWQVRVAYGPSHDEQSQDPFQVSNVGATGTGRYENFAIVVRYPVGSRDSVEAAWNRRKHQATDLLDIGRERFFLTEQRALSAERMDVGLGLRHRWEGFEAAVSGRLVRPSGADTTAGLSQRAEGSLYGGAFEGRAQRGHWTLSASAERASGRIPVHEASAPDFLPRDTRETATLEAYRLGVGYAARRTEVFFQATYDRSLLPMVDFAVLGTEVTAFESGLHPDSRARVTLLDLTFRQTLAPGFRAKVLLRSSRGNETVTLTDPTGVQPPRVLDVQRSGVFGAGLSHLLGGPEVTLAVGAEIALPIGK